MWRVCYLALMAHTVVSLLAERPPAELRTMLARAEQEVARLRSEIAHSEVEVHQIEQALALQARREAGSSTQRGETREQVLEAFRVASGIATPAQIIAALRSEGATVGSGAIRNMIRRLADDGALERVGQGRYQLPSRNGSEPNPFLEGAKNEAGEPLSAATQPQEAASES